MEAKRILELYREASDAVNYYGNPQVTLYVKAAELAALCSMAISYLNVAQQCEDLKQRLGKLEQEQERRE